MSLRILVAIVVATVLAFSWGGFAWTSGLYEGWAFRPLPQDSGPPNDLSERLAGALRESGAYVYPGWPVTEGVSEQQAKLAMASWEAQREAGPQMMVLVNHQGIAASGDMTMARGFVLEFFTSAIIAVVIAIAAKFGAHAQDRIAIAFAMAAFAVCAGPAVQWNFLHLPDSYALAMGIDTFMAWLLAGLACALIIRPLKRGEKVA
ncbi:MAG: hypothetical protein JNK53_04120 [Phycisphaerae bacterium]|nr:hypothetical protein [Phycisphaerae bacterium]